MKPSKNKIKNTKIKHYIFLISHQFANVSILTPNYGRPVRKTAAVLSVIDVSGALSDPGQIKVAIAQVSKALPKWGKKGHQL